jgi:mono/diheme cytochrome c family protein
MKQLITIGVVLSTVVVFSCTKKASPGKTEAPKAPAVTYAGNVKALVQSKCTPCHIPADGGRKASLDNYDAVKNAIADMILRVERAPTERGFMPFKRPALSAEEIALLKSWKDAGTPQ